jgi:hypothetical protein
MQVLIQDTEFRRFQRIAKRKGLTLAEWVRQVLRLAAGSESVGDGDRKLALVRAAARHAFPAPDVEQMLAEIEKGYESGPSE